MITDVLYANSHVCRSTIRDCAHGEWHGADVRLNQERPKQERTEVLLLVHANSCSP